MTISTLARVGVGAAILGVGIGVLAVAPAQASSHAESPRQQASSVTPAGTNYVSINLKNDTTQAFTVKMSGRSGSGLTNATLLPGQSMSGYGSYQTSAYGLDVVATVTYTNGQKVNLWGYTPPLVGWPSVGFTSASDWNTEGSNWQRFGVNQTTNFTEGGRDFTVTRAADLPAVGMNFHISVR